MPVPLQLEHHWCQPLQPLLNSHRNRDCMSQQRCTHKEQGPPKTQQAAKQKSAC